MPPVEPGKEYALSFEHRPLYLYAYVEGERDNYDISRRYWQEIADRLKTTDYDRVLVDENIEQTASMIDTFQLVSEFPQMGFRGMKVAFYDRKIDHQEMNEFGELVAANRGLNGRVFNDLDLAIAWIESGE